MKKIALTALAAIALSTSAIAADMKMVTKAPPAPPPSPWDVAFGGALMTDYIFRGVTQSNHKPSVAAYVEARYNSNANLQWYAGVSGESIDFPNRAAAEIDLYGGVRPTFGALALDFGYWYYYYPGGQCFNGAIPGCAMANLGISGIPNGNVAKADASFWEVYAKGTWTINDQWALGFNVFVTPNFLALGADGQYVSGTVKYTAPASANIFNGAVGWYVSGELGEQFLGSSDQFYGTGVVGSPFRFSVPYADYTTWNVGVGFTYKVFTLDLRYSDTSLSDAQCNVFTSDHTAGGSGAQGSLVNPSGVQSKWCGSTFVAKLAFDMTLGALK
jgi:uncharacterized protein (TIGR02001 family)